MPDAPHTPIPTTFREMKTNDWKTQIHYSATTEFSKIGVAVQIEETNTCRTPLDSIPGRLHHKNITQNSSNNKMVRFQHLKGLLS